MPPHHPWRAMRALPDWHVHFTDQLPEKIRGVTRWSDQTVWIQTGLTQAERRSVIEHELQHILRGPGGRRDREEATVRQSAARRLIPLGALAEALQWSYDEHDLADELWVGVPTIRARLAGLSDQEKRHIEEVLDDEWR